MPSVGIEVSSEIYVAILEAFFYPLKSLLSIANHAHVIFRVVHYF